MFSVSQIDSVPLVIPFSRADADDAKLSLSLLIAELNIKKPLLFDLAVRRILDRVNGVDLVC